MKRQRIFWRADDAPTCLRALLSPRGSFIPTRAPVEVGTTALLALDLPGHPRFELQVDVLGRRWRHRRDDRLKPGVIVRLHRPLDEAALLFADFAAGRVIDLRARARAARPVVQARFEDVGGFIDFLAQLVLDERPMIAVRDPLPPKEPITIAATSGEQAVQLGGRVSGVVLRDGERFVRVRVDEAERDRLRQALHRARARRMSG